MNVDEGHKRNVKGHETEMLVLRRLEEFIRSRENLNAKIFHSIKTRAETLAGLCIAFGTILDLSGFKKNKAGFYHLRQESDFFIITNFFIILVEVKSNPAKLSEAIKQVKIIENLIPVLLNCIGKPDTKIPVRKVVVFPSLPQNNQLRQKSQNNEKIQPDEDNSGIIVCEIGERGHIEGFEKVFKNLETDTTIEEDTVKDLILALVFLGCTKFINHPPGTETVVKDGTQMMVN